MLAMVNGEDLEDFRRAQALDMELTKDSKKYRRLSADKWPPLTFNWDHAPSSQRLVLDGFDEAKFRNAYPAGLKLGRLSLIEFDNRLCHSNRRRLPDELWIGDVGKLAKVIAYLRRGLPITPPLVAAKAGQFVLAGGNHRYTAARASGLEQLEIYVAPDDVVAVQTVYAIDWLT